MGNLPLANRFGPSEPCADAPGEIPRCFHSKCWKRQVCERGEFKSLDFLVLVYYTASAKLRLSTRRSMMARANNLGAVVEVVPVVAGAHPVVIGGGVVGLVVGVGGRVVKLAGLGVLAGSLGVKRSSSLTVESLKHLQTKTRVRQPANTDSSFPT